MNLRSGENLPVEVISSPPSPLKDSAEFLQRNLLLDENRFPSIFRGNYHDRGERIVRRGTPTDRIRFPPIYAYIWYSGKQPGIPYQPLQPQKILRTDHLQVLDPFISTGNFIS